MHPSASAFAPARQGPARIPVLVQTRVKTLILTPVPAPGSAHRRPSRRPVFRESSAARVSAVAALHRQTYARPETDNSIRERADFVRSIHLIDGYVQISAAQRVCDLGQPENGNRQAAGEYDRDEEHHRERRDQQHHRITVRLCHCAERLVVVLLEDQNPIMLGTLQFQIDIILCLM